MAITATADTVIINPGVGVTSNVEEKITGTTDVSIRSGLVTLNGENDYTGWTTVSNGTLIVTNAAVAGAASSVGASGWVDIQNGVFRYSGEDGATFGHSVTSRTLKADVNTSSVAFDLRNDLTFNGAFVMNWSPFVKCGPGTMTLKGSSNSSTMWLVGTGGSGDNAVTRNDKTRFFLPGDGTMPTTGVAIASLLQGKMVVVKGSAKILQTGSITAIGRWTAAENEQESDCELELNGGNFESSTIIAFGNLHGFQDYNTPNGPAKAYATIKSGTMTQSGGKSCQFGSWDGPPVIDGVQREYNTDIKMEILTEGIYTHGSSYGGFNVYQRKGQPARIIVNGGIFRDYVIYVGGAATSGDTTGTLLVDLSNKAKFYSLKWVNNAGKVATQPPVQINIKSGSEFYTHVMMANDASMPGNTSILIDDGTYGIYNSTDGNTGHPQTYVQRKVIAPAWLTKLELGAGGAKLVSQAKSKTGNLPNIAIFEKGFSTEATLAADGGMDGGLTIASKTSEHIVELAGTNTYNGPTVLESGILTLSGVGVLPQASAFRADGGILWASVKDVAIGDFNVASNFTLKVSDGYQLIVSNSIVQAAGTRIALSGISAGATEVAVISAPVALKSALEALRFSLDTADGLKLSRLQVTDDGETATLKADVVAAESATGIASFAAGANYTGSVLLGNGKYEVDVSVQMKDGAANGTFDIGTFKAADQTAADAVAALALSSYPHVQWHSQSYAAVQDGESWKLQLTVATAGADGTWAKPSEGGAWATAENWTGVVPDGFGMSAIFPAASAANVPVTLGSVTLGALHFDGEATAVGGYAFSGTELKFDSVNEPDLRVKSGQHTIAAPVTVGAKGLKLDSTNGTEIALSKLKGTGKVKSNTATLSAGGQVTLDTTEFTGTLVTGAARTKVNDLGFITQASDLELGSGSLQYTGDSVEVEGMRLNPGISSMARASVLDIANADTVLTLKRLTFGYGMLVKHGPGTLRFKGNGTFDGNQVQYDGTTSDTGRNQAERYVAANGDAPNRGVKGLTIAQGELIVGTVGDDTDAPDVGGYMIAVGYGDPVATEGSQVIRAVVNNGKFCTWAYNGANRNTWCSDLYVGYTVGNPKNNQTVACELIQNGGEVKGGNLEIGYSSGNKTSRFSYRQFGGKSSFSGAIVTATCNGGNTTSGTNDLTVAGGTFEASQNLCGTCSPYGKNTGADKGAYGMLRLLGGAINVSGYVNVNSNLITAAEMELAGEAVLTTKNIIHTAFNGTSIVRFNGGTFKPKLAGSLTGITHVYAGTNATTISTENVPANGEYTIAETIAPDPILVADTDAGLAKTGAQDLVLAAAMTFRGPLAINGGKVRITSAVTELGSVSFAEGTKLEIPEGTVLKVKSADYVEGGVTKAAPAGTYSKSSGGVLSGFIEGDGSLKIQHGTTIYLW